MNRSSSTIALAVATAALVLTACGGAGDTSSDNTVDEDQSLSSLETNAKEEGALVLYSAFSEGPLQDLVTAFEETYPEIEVEFTRKTTAELMQQFTSEADAGINAVDVVTTASRDPIVAGCEADQFTEISGLPSAADFPDETFDGCSAVVNIAPWGIWWNTDAVSADEAPETYEDLLDPAWSGGKLGIPDPGNTDTYIWLLTVMEDSVGDGFLEELRAQEPAYGPSGTPLVESVVARSLHLMCCTPVDVVEPLKAAGAPIDGIVPEPTMGSERTVGVATAAPHPNAARLFVNWMMSPEGQEVVSKDNVSPLTDIPGTLEPLNDFQPLVPEMADPNGDNGLRIRDALGRP